MTEFGFRFFALDRKLGIDPEWRSINMDFLVDRQRAARRKWNALRADALIVCTQWRFSKEDERAVFLAQCFSLFGIRRHEFANLVHRHFFFLYVSPIHLKFDH